jgi:hypothetical protein
MLWGLEQSVRLTDVRALLELLAEVRELGITSGMASASGERAGTAVRRACRGVE